MQRYPLTSCDTLRFARLFEGQSKPVVFPDSSATRGVCRRVRCGRQNHVQVRFLWLQEAVADGRVEVRGASTRPSTPHSDLGTRCLDKQRRAALISMMPLTQFRGMAERWGAALGLLAGLVVAAGNRAPMTSDLVKVECEIDTMYEAWRQALTSTGAPWVLVVILIALNVLGMAVLWLVNVKSSPGAPAVTPNETTKQVQRGQAFEGTMQVPLCGHSLGRWSRR